LEWGGVIDGAEKILFRTSPSSAVLAPPPPFLKIVSPYDVTKLWVLPAFGI